MDQLLKTHIIKTIVEDVFETKHVRMSDEDTTTIVKFIEAGTAEDVVVYNQGGLKIDERYRENMAGV